MRYDQNNHVVRKTLLEDTRLKLDLSIAVQHFMASDSNLASVFNLRCGPVDAQINITPAQCREFAAHLLAHADEFEARLVRTQEEEVAT